MLSVTNAIEAGIQAIEAVRGTVAGRRLGAPEGGGGGVHLPMHLWGYTPSSSGCQPV